MWSKSNRNCPSYCCDRRTPIITIRLCAGVIKHQIVSLDVVFLCDVGGISRWSPCERPELCPRPVLSSGEANTYAWRVNICPHHDIPVSNYSEQLDEKSSECCYTLSYILHFRAVWKKQRGQGRAWEGQVWVHQSGVRSGTLAPRFPPISFSLRPTVSRCWFTHNSSASPVRLFCAVASDSTREEGPELHPPSQSHHGRGVIQDVRDSTHRTSRPESSTSKTGLSPEMLRDHRGMCWERSRPHPPAASLPQGQRDPETPSTSTAFTDWQPGRRSHTVLFVLRQNLREIPGALSLCLSVGDMRVTEQRGRDRSVAAGFRLLSQRT